MDEVDRSIGVGIGREKLSVIDTREDDKLTASTSCSGSLIITDCGGESSSRSSRSFSKHGIPKVPIGLKLVALLSMVIYK